MNIIIGKKEVTSLATTVTHRFKLSIKSFQLIRSLSLNTFKNNFMIGLHSESIQPTLMQINKRSGPGVYLHSYTF